MIVVSSVCTVTQIRSYLCQSKRMCRRIDLRYNIHSVYPWFLNQVSELVFCIEYVFTRQIRLIQTVFSAFFNIRFQTECRICLHRIFSDLGIVLQRDQVIVQMDLEVVHLIPWHLFYRIFQPVHCKRLTSDIQKESAHFIKRVVSCNTLRNISVRFQAL